MVVERTDAMRPEDNLVMIVYGKAGAGKTTFAASAPRPLILDFENGTKYLGTRGISADVIRMKDWFSANELLELDKLMKNYDTIVIDPLGEAMEKLINSPYILGRQYRQGDGSLTLSGWGEAKEQMRTFIKGMRDSRKHVVIVSHVKEVRTEQGLEKRIQVATGLADEIPNMVDLISYLGVQKKGDEGFVRALYTPSQGGLFDSKDRTGRIPQIVEIGEKTGWSDLIRSMGSVELEPVPQSAPQPMTQPSMRPEPQAPAFTPQPVPSSVPAPQADGRITQEQVQRMRELADKMLDPVGRSYLLQMVHANITSADAQVIIDRAVASMGGV